MAKKHRSGWGWIITILLILSTLGGVIFFNSLWDLLKPKNHLFLWTIIGLVLMFVPAAIFGKKFIRKRLRST